MYTHGLTSGDISIFCPNPIYYRPSTPQLRRLYSRLINHGTLLRSTHSDTERRNSRVGGLRPSTLLIGHSYKLLTLLNIQ